MNRLYSAALGLAALSCVCSTAFADSLRDPLWEVGVAAAGSTFPDYRGAQQYSVFGLPAPYAAYRGERFRLSREGASASLFEELNAELSLSLATSLPGDADDNPNRAGMPDIDATFEIGPSLDFVLQRDPGGWTHRLRIPARAVVATDLQHFDGIGWLIHPNFEASRNWLAAGTAWGVTLSVGPLFATEKYHDYFYDVQPQYARLDRPSFDADGGYSGARANLILTWRRGDTRIGTFLLYDNLSGATFEDSPLVETEHSLIVGIGIARRIWRSERFAPKSPVREPPAPPARQQQ
ncbi:MAG: MipA/OmpV family protein [Abyssibacter sp.]|uniref:MipA/OmpV family protein n=1 Tax=Abyssibacter sp. TaxID=2320200 RepID=UPI002EBBC84B|nr:MipA/OmpV family protein [Pseudomonadota bacterium]